MTPRRAASVVSASKPTPPSIDTNFAELDLKAAQIIDVDAVLTAIERDAEGADAREIRTITVRHLKAAIAAGRTAIAEAFTAKPRASRSTVRA